MAEGVASTVEKGVKRVVNNIGGSLYGRLRLCLLLISNEYEPASIVENFAIGVCEV